MRSCGARLLVAAAGLLAGCTAPAPVRLPQERVIEGATPDQVLAEAAVILKREFGRIHVDRALQQITTDPVEFTTERESGSVRDLYRGRSHMRRSATFSVGERGGMTIARLRVDVERQDTGRDEAVPPAGSRISDLPGQDMPTEHATAEQSRVWTYVRRDTGLARALLEELQERFARVAADVETQPARRTP